MLIEILCYGYFIRTLEKKMLPVIKIGLFQQMRKYEKKKSKNLLKFGNFTKIKNKISATKDKNLQENH